MADLPSVVTPPTVEEHETRAMLLGRFYDYSDGTYCQEDNDGIISVYEMLDCLTLEVISYEDATARKVAFTGKQKPWQRDDD